MAPLDLVRQRLLNQHIAMPPVGKAEDVVAWLGAVQAQDYAGAKWALGVRLPHLTEAAIEQAFSDGTILRTHVMRPTWHFVTPADIRWMLALTAPRVKALTAHYERKLGLDDTIFRQSNAALEKTLQGGRQLTRPELGAALQQAGIATDNLLRFTYVIMRAELDGVVCSGPRRGKQFTYALLEERAPQVGTLDRDEALARLAQRYFTSHGPATLQDYVWWSGLALVDAKAGLEMIQSQLEREVIDGKPYWFAPLPANTAVNDTTPAVSVYLLPDYDEYVVGYTDRGAVFDNVHIDKLDARGSILATYTIVIDGRIAGTWKRTFKKGAVALSYVSFISLTATELEAFADAARRYGEFLGMPVVLE